MVVNRGLDTGLLRGILDTALGRCQSHEWYVRTDEFWCRVTPHGGDLPAQGWKLHVSATMLSAPVILARVAEVLLENRCQFKFVARLDDLWSLLAPHADRASAGKFITIYPNADSEAVRLAALLHEVTFGLPGPRILSDEPYRPGSIVHYRYGTFAGYPMLGAEGFYERRLQAPDGTLVRDSRVPWFSPPSFAVSPFKADQPVVAGVEAVMLGGRFVVRKAVRHANRGGVYVAEDRHTGARVIVKEARPHTASDLSGEDARSRIAAERRCLDMLAGSKVAPAVVAAFEQEGHRFLVTELIEGTNLRRWLEEQAGPVGDNGFGSHAKAVLPIVERLIELVDGVHRHGLTIRDLSPGNVMVQPDGELRLVDLECATLPGTPVLGAGTPGYVAPELVALVGHHVPAPGQETDLFSLGAIVFFLAVGAEVAIPSDELARPDSCLYIDAYISRAASANATLTLLLPLVRGLLAKAEERWPLDRCRKYLATLEPLATVDSAPAPHPHRGDAEIVDRLVDDAMAYLVQTMGDPHNNESLWPATTDGLELDPCAVNAGAAGILGVFTNLVQVSDRPAVRKALAGGVRWLQHRLAAEDTWPPGLYFGRSGSLWALFEAGEVLDAPTVVEFAAAAARQLPVSHPCPDVTHGLAGAAMTMLRIGMRDGDADLLDRAEEAAGNLCAARSYLGGHPVWTTAPDMEADLAGMSHFGFAHGLAGIGTALLYAGVALDRPAFVTAAGEVAHALKAYAEVDADTAWWPVQRHEPTVTRPRRPHWCSGSSGIGSFLVRYWHATGDTAALDLADKAANAVYRTRWQSGTVPCHGLPGDAELLLDMATFTGDERHRHRAQELAGCVAARAVTRRALLLVPARNFAIDPTYLGGVAGTASYLLRLRRPHPRPWLLDDVVWPALHPAWAASRPSIPRLNFEAATPIA